MRHSTHNKKKVENPVDICWFDRQSSVEQSRRCLKENFDRNRFDESGKEQMFRHLMPTSSFASIVINCVSGVSGCVSSMGTAYNSSTYP